MRHLGTASRPPDQFHSYAFRQSDRVPDGHDLVYQWLLQLPSSMVQVG
jgi:hypothetical protein